MACPTFICLSETKFVLSSNAFCLRCKRPLWVSHTSLMSPWIVLPGPCGAMLNLELPRAWAISDISPAQPQQEGFRATPAAGQASTEQPWSFHTGVVHKPESVLWVSVQRPPGQIRLLKSLFYLKLYYEIIFQKLNSKLDVYFEAGPEASERRVGVPLTPILTKPL